MATSPSGKSYIGQTVQTLDKRIKKHYIRASNCTYAFANALNKYPRESWKWNVLYDNISRIYLDNMEIWCVSNYNTYYGKGYNSTLGGDDNPTNNHLSIVNQKYPNYRHYQRLVQHNHLP